jgi:hypothetical protein
MLPEMKSQYYEITVTSPHSGEEIKIKLHWEADAWDWQNVFKQIMNWVTFHPDTYKEIFALTDDEILEKEEKETKTDKE